MVGECKAEVTDGKQKYKVTKHTGDWEESGLVSKKFSKSCFSFTIM